MATREGPSPALVALRHAYLSARTALEAELQGTGLTSSQLEVLKVLVAAPDATVDQRTLPGALHITTATLTRLLTGMERRGLIRRLPHPTDSRGKRVVALPAARKRFGQLMALREAAFNARLLAGFSRSETALLCSLLDRMADNMRR